MYLPAKSLEYLTGCCNPAIRLNFFLLKTSRKYKLQDSNSKFQIPKPFFNLLFPLFPISPIPYIPYSPIPLFPYFPIPLFPIPYSLFPYSPISLFPYSHIPLFPYSPIPISRLQFPDSSFQTPQYLSFIILFTNSAISVFPAKTLSSCSII
jgi:hypothetical protein